MVETALANRPDIRAAQAQIAGTHAAVDLAKGDRIPTPILGPQYAMDEAGVQYVGLIWVTPLPLLNSGKPLVVQREAEHHRAAVAAAQAQQRAVAQVRAAVARWNGATDLVNDSSGLSEELAQGGRQAGAALRAAADRPDPADAGASAADPARQLAARRRLGRHPGAGRPPAGPGHALADPRHAQPGRARRRRPGRPGGTRHRRCPTPSASSSPVGLVARPTRRSGRADRKPDGPRGPLNSEGERAARRAGRRVLFEHRVASPGPARCSKSTLRRSRRRRSYTLQDPADPRPTRRTPTRRTAAGRESKPATLHPSPSTRETSDPGRPPVEAGMCRAGGSFRWCRLGRNRTRTGRRAETRMRTVLPCLVPRISSRPVITRVGSTIGTSRKGIFRWRFLSPSSRSAATGLRVTGTGGPSVGPTADGAAAAEAVAASSPGMGLSAMTALIPQSCASGVARDRKSWHGAGGVR